MVLRLSGDKDCEKLCIVCSITGCRRPDLCSDAANLLVGVWLRGRFGNRGCSAIAKFGNFRGQTRDANGCRREVIETICILHE